MQPQEYPPSQTYKINGKSKTQIFNAAKEMFEAQIPLLNTIEYQNFNEGKIIIRGMSICWINVYKVYYKYTIIVIARDGSIDFSYGNIRFIEGSECEYNDYSKPGIDEAMKKIIQDILAEIKAWVT